MILNNELTSQGSPHAWRFQRPSCPTVSHRIPDVRHVKTRLHMNPVYMWAVSDSTFSSGASDGEQGPGVHTVGCEKHQILAMTGVSGTDRRDRQAAVEAALPPMLDSAGFRELSTSSLQIRHNP